MHLSQTQIIIAVSKLIDDSQIEGWREPSHSEIEFQVKKAELLAADPKSQGQNVGKAKRVREILYWALENDEIKGGMLLVGLISLIRGCGGFRADSLNYVGDDVIQTAISAFDSEGFKLSSDGQLQPLSLENLSGVSLTKALEAYARRAQKGITDAALVVGTSKDLLEATAAHVLVTRFGTYSEQSHFPTLLAQAFMALDIAIPEDTTKNKPLDRLDKSLYEAGCAINTLRNKQGTGHGRPWETSLSDTEAKTAVEIMGIIAERMLNKLNLSN